MPYPVSDEEDDMKNTTIQQDFLGSHIRIALDQGIDHAVVVETSHVYTAPWVRMKCQFGCPGYGETLCCPPNTPTPEEMRKVLDSYAYGLLLHLHWRKNYTTVDNFNVAVVELERTLFLDGYYKAWAMGSGPCDRCKECNTAGTCLHASQARPSMEACGIDVFKTAREQGLPIHVVTNHEAERDLYALILVD
jgi:predicted metal-binding protein